MAKNSDTGFPVRFTRFLPQVGSAVRRFPFAGLLSIALTGFLILVLHDVWGLKHNSELSLRVAGVLACGFFWAVSMTLNGEVRRWTGALAHLTGVVGVLVLAVLFWFDRALDLVPYALCTALILLVGIVPYLFRPANNQAFWAYNHTLWTGAAFAGIAGVLLGVGASAVFGTLEYLFKVDIHRTVWEMTWVFALFFVAPLYFLNAVPDRFDVEVSIDAEGDGDLMMRLISTIVKFILVPLLLLYTAILYVYAAKIGFGWELPKGRLGYMVSAFGSVGVVTALLVYPWRHKAGAVVSFFWRHWFWLTLLPLGLLAIGLWRRLSDYGLTHERYLLGLVGVWLLVVVMLFGLRRTGRDLRIIPGALAGLLAVASIGPWGMDGAPARGLAAELRQILSAEGSLDASGILKGKISDTIERDKATTRRMASIIFYLRRHNRLDLIRPMFGDEAGELFASTDAGSRDGKFDTSSALARYLSVPLRPSSRRNVEMVSFHANRPGDFPLAVGGTLRGPTTLFREADKDDDGVLKDASGVLTATLKQGQLVLKRGDALVGAYDLWKFMARINKGVDTETPLVLETIAGRGASRLIVTSLYGEISDTGAYKLTNMRIWIATPGR